MEDMKGTSPFFVAKKSWPYVSPKDSRGLLSSVPAHETPERNRRHLLVLLSSLSRSFMCVSWALPSLSPSSQRRVLLSPRV